MKHAALSAVLGTVLVLLATGCGGDDDDLDLSGNWNLTADVQQDTCQVTAFVPELETISAQLTIEQTGSTVHITDNDGFEVTGSLQGGTLEFQGSETVTADNGCVLTLAYDGQGDATERRISGDLMLRATGTAATCGVAVNCPLLYVFTMTR